MKKMIKLFAFFISLLISVNPALAVTSRPADYVSENTYNNLYPYMNNTMKANLNPGTSPSLGNAQINVMTRTIPSATNTERRVVPRQATARSARSATAGTASYQPVARSASTTNFASTNNSARRVVPRQATARSATTTSNYRASVNGNTVSRSERGDNSYISQTYQNAQNNPISTEVSIPSSRCLADYMQCMNNYCERKDTAYNRCYCSSKLAQIDSKYQPEIDRLIKEILKAKNQGPWTDEEMNDYWMEMIGQHTGSNSWENLENALDIDWSSTESRVRGQYAYTTGHEYCVQHLRGCYYMAANLKDAYLSEIARDCATYESSLQRLQSAAESILEYYK